MSSYPRKYSLFQFKVLQKIEISIVDFFKDLIKIRLRIPYARKEYFISQGDFSINDSITDGVFITGRIGKVKGAITQQVFNPNTQRFESRELSFDDVTGANYTNFLYVDKKKTLLIQESITMTPTNVQIFFNHAIEKIIGRNTLINEVIFDSTKDLYTITSPAMEDDLNQILAWGMSILNEL